MKRFIFVLAFLYLVPCAVFAKLLCLKHQYLVRAHSRASYIRSDGVLVKATQVKSFCKDRTALSDFWTDRLKNGRPPGWPYKSEKGAQWTVAEKERFLEALELVPEILQNLKTMTGVYRLARSQKFPNPATHGNDNKTGLIVLYDNAFGPQQPLERILIHELSHELFASFSEEDQASYRRALGWKVNFRTEDRGLYRIPRETGFVKEDGRTSVTEDFANNIEYFLFEPDVLKKVTPEAYKWIQSRFGANFKLRGVK